MTGRGKGQLSASIGVQAGISLSICFCIIMGNSMEANMGFAYED